MKLTPRKVPRRVGMNPVARAVARAQLRDAVRSQKIALYLWPEGAECAADVALIGQMFAVLAEAAALDPNVGAAAPEVRVLRGASSACEQLMHSNRWHPRHRPALEVALDAALAVNARLNPEIFNRVWNSRPRLGV